MQVIYVSGDHGNQGWEWEETEGKGERPNKGCVILCLPLRTSGTHSYWGTLWGTYRMHFRFILQRPGGCLRFPLVEGRLTSPHFQALALLGWVSSSSLGALCLSYHQDHCLEQPPLARQLPFTYYSTKETGWQKAWRGMERVKPMRHCLCIKFLPNYIQNPSWPEIT